MRQFTVVLFLLTALAGFGQAPRQTRQARWQQWVDYSISAKLNDTQHTLSAQVKMVYYNNSPNELKEMYIHLWPNAYKTKETAYARHTLQSGNTRFHYAREDEQGWIDSLDFKAGGQRVKWYLTDDIDICRLELNAPIKPGGALEITTPFKVQIPGVFSRMGHEGQQYCMTQWYPKPAVYDVNGWNPIPYLDQGEFYSDFGTFEVKLTVPQNYIVAATGNLQNEEEKQWLLEKSKSRFVAQQPIAVPPSSPEWKTLVFSQDSVHDFAWFCDKRFSVERSEVTLENGKKVTTWVYEAAPKASSVHWVDTAISFYSRMLGPYPYDHASVVVTPLRAGAGMEYPTITNMEKADREVIIHEVGHNWFYGILATNERLYPWMDESFNNYYEARCGYVKRPVVHKGLELGLRNGGKGLTMGFGESEFSLYQLQYLLNARSNNDQAVNRPAPEYTDVNYGNMIYGKGPLLFLYLQDYMGETAFDGMMKKYYGKWKFRHPLPDDFFDELKRAVPQGTDWFVNDLMGSTKKPDYKLVSYKKGVATIRNKSGIKEPISISSMKGGSVISTIWLEGFEGTKRFDFNVGGADKVRLDAYETALDVYRDNNTVRTSGVLRSVEPLQFKFLGDAENPQQTQLFYSPIAGFNLYNKGMLGVALYNGLIPQRRIDFVFTPMFSFGTRDLAGYGNLTRHFYTEGFFNRIDVGGDLARFAYEYSANPATYNKIAPYLKFDFAKSTMRSPVTQFVRLRSVFVVNEANRKTESLYPIPDDSRIDEVKYEVVNKQALGKGMLAATIQNIHANGNALKAFVEMKQEVPYDHPKKKLSVRVFAGTFLTNNKSMPGEYQFKLSGNTGLYDYTFDEALMGRSESGFRDGFFARQVIEREGNLHLPQSISSSDKWILSANMATTIPGPVPVRIFADLGYINNTAFAPQTGTYSYEPAFQYTAGLRLVLAEDIMEVNFPLFYSDDFETVYALIPRYADENKFKQLARRITFVLNLNKLNPIKGIRNAF